MRFDISNHNINPLSPKTVTFVQHLVGLPDPRAWTEVDLEFAQLPLANDR
jgi:hypothetical protein